ncbi:MAG: hypothetical protein AABZ31_03650 [Bdellovibrionota bacterium]
MATTSTMRTDTVRTHNTYNANNRKAIYGWVIGALILAALIIFFSMDRTRNVDTISAPATVTAPTTVESSSAVGNGISTGTGETTDTGNVDTDVSGAAAAPNMNQTTGTESGTATGYDSTGSTTSPGSLNQ